MATGIIISPEFLQHDTGEHPERKARYHAIVEGLQADHDWWQSLQMLAPRAASDTDLLRCHTPEPLARIAAACAQGRAALDADTVVSSASDHVARLAAGSACAAVDAVLTAQVSAAFVACRPPGHHATISEPMGFCLYNNIAVAARYAQATFPEQVQRVLIADFDVHHGNGTQDIFYADPSVYFFNANQG